MSRDPRFDGKFFIAVKTTKVYCRPICRVKPPLEKNVTYYDNAVAAAQAGFRPCLKCRPDSAPGSPAWNGTETTFQRAIKLIQAGALQRDSLACLANRLGITERYLRKLFEQYCGVPPKTYALYQQCLFAKQLLHETDLAVTDIALASGFNSIRRFNDCFKRQIKLTPSEVRKSARSADPTPSLTLNLSYRPPYNWKFMQSFFSHRVIPGLDWVEGDSYGRTFRYNNAKGLFIATAKAERHQFAVTINIDDITQLQPVIQNIKRLLDLDCDSETIDDHLATQLGIESVIEKGVRIPGVWDPFEAGIRAILGQQISVAAAKTLVTQLLAELGEPSAYNKEPLAIDNKPSDVCTLFPTPKAIMNSDLSFFRMPGKRKETLKAFAAHYAEHQDHNIDSILDIKGIGRWTLDYIKLRGQSDPNVFLGGDLGIKKAMAKIGHEIDLENVAPWQSYLTFQLWNQ